MPNYTILTQSGRSRLLRSNSDQTSEVVTTLPAGAPAATIAEALTEATSDLPHRLVSYVLDHLDLWSLDPDDFRHSGSLDSWGELPAAVKPFSLKLRALNVFDHGEERRLKTPAAGISWSGLYDIVRLRDLMVDQPISVVRAVRDELAAAFEPYHQSPVLARAYDYKWGDCDSLFLANAGLALLPAEKLHQIASQPTWHGLALITALGEAGLADFDYVESTSMSGYLEVDVNRQQLHTWLEANNLLPPVES